MSGLCSQHRGITHPDCPLCAATPKDIFPDWDEKFAEAKAAGSHVCAKCGFKFFKTVVNCPLCRTPRPTMNEHFDIPAEMLPRLIEQHKLWGPVRVPDSLQRGLTPEQERDLRVILEDRRVTDLSAHFWMTINRKQP